MILKILYFDIKYNNREINYKSHLILFILKFSKDSW